MDDLAIKTEGLTKYYRGSFWKLAEKPALEDLNLEVARGSVFGFLGPNGAGKTTTIRCLMDLIRPTRGKAWVLGQSSREVDVRERIGYLPDGPTFASYLTAQQFLMLCARLLKIPKDQRNERVERVLVTVRMAEHAKSKLGNFSRGMIQRIGIAQSLLNDPELLILDEPLVGLDPEGRRDLLRILRDQRDSGVAVFFCSHVLSDVEKLCDSVGILARGKLLCAGALGDLLDAKGLVLRVPESEDALARELMPRAKSSTHASGQWELEFTEEEGAEEIRTRTFPAGVTIAPRKETLEEFFFRLVENVGGAFTPGTEPGSAAAGEADELATAAAAAGEDTETNDDAAQ